MSLRFKQLLIEKKITQKELADELYRSPRTIRNWVKENGTVPTLETASAIAKVIGVTTYDVYSCFINDPDYGYENDKEHFAFNSHKADEGRSELSAYAPGLFHYLNTYHLFGSGILRYNTDIFRFSGIFFCKNETDDLFEQLALAPFTGMILVDDYLNIVPIQKNSITSWKIENSSFDNLTVQINTTDIIMSSMTKRSPLDDKKHTIYITIWKYQEGQKQFDLGQYFIRKKEQDDVIPTYIKEYRKRSGMTQEDFANSLLDSLDGKKISKWETKRVTPSLKQIQQICIFYNISEEALLDAYDNSFFANHSADKEWNCFENIGINYLFKEADSTRGLSKFVDACKFINKTIWGNDFDKPLAYIESWSNTDEVSHQIAISDIVTDNKELSLHIDNKESIAIDWSNLAIIEKRNLQNYVYQIYGTYSNNDSVIYFATYFSWLL